MTTPPICDYEDSDYRTRFWENQGREYEDAVERIAINRLLPPSGGILMDLGAGFGRLADMFSGYRRVVLFDYSHSQLVYARSQLGDERFVYVAGDFYRLPFIPGLFDTINQVRVIHHAADAPAVIRQVGRVLKPAGVYLLEFANKQNLKAIIRFLFKRQQWSPYRPEPVEFVELNYNFSPRWIREQLAAAGLQPERMLTVSHFRLDLLKRIVPTSLLVAMDKLSQHTGRWWQLTPSVFIRSQAENDGPTATESSFFACPECQTPLETPDSLLEGRETPDGQLGCSGCGRAWPIRDGVFIFK